MTYVAPICGVFHEETRVLHGIGWEFVQGLIAAGAARVEHAPPEVPIGPHNYRGNVSYHPEYYKLHCAEMLRRAGVEMFTNCRVIDCDCENGHVSRVYFAGKNGIEALDCAHVIDATGDGTLAKLAGVPMLDNDNLLPMSLCFLLEGADTSTPLLGDYIHHDGRTFNGSNPVIAHDFLGGSLEGKDVVVCDDMIASGGSMLDTARQLKEMGAKRVFLFSTFGLFTSGLEKFDKAYAAGWFDRVFTTNLVYQTPELLQREYYYSVHIDRYIAALIDTLNRGGSIHDLTKPAMRIRRMVELFKGEE